MATIAWGPPAPWPGGTLDGYRVEERVGQGPWRAIASPAPTTLVLRTGPLPPGAYEWRVTALHADSTGIIRQSMPAAWGTPPPCLTVHLAPTVTIATPTAADTYTTTVPTLTVAGTAQDDNAVQDVHWQCTHTTTGESCGGGTATGTTAWTVPTVTVKPGTSRVEVTVRDTYGATGTDTLLIVYDVGAPTPPTTVTATPG
jgi:hypothetical protein